MIINEANRNELVAKSKSAAKEKDGKTRYQKRIKSHVANNVKNYNRIDMNQLFKDDIITIAIDVKGETDNYIVKLSWGGLLDTLKNELKRNSTTQLELKNIVRAIVISFNKNDVYIRCNCPDFQYRIGFWASKNDIITGEKELRPSDITNPKDTLGSGCKHIMCVLANTSWIIKVASVIKNYIEYMKKNRESLYAKVIYPVIYNKKYEEPVQTTVFDEDELETDEETIDTSNKEARTKGQFKSGNPYRFTKSEEPDENQINIDDVTEESEE